MTGREQTPRCPWNCTVWPPDAPRTHAVGCRYEDERREQSGGTCPAYADEQHRVGPYLHVESGIRYMGCVCQDAPTPETAAPSTAQEAGTVTTEPCQWCGRAITHHKGSVWYAVKGAERGYDARKCDASPDIRHEPDGIGRYQSSNERKS